MGVWRAILTATAVASCGAPPGAPPAAHAEVEACRSERAALERRLAAAEERIDELERESVPPVAAPAAPAPSDAETVRIQFPKEKFDSLFQDPKRLMQSARIVPVAERDGRVSGLRIFGVRPGAELDQLGFRNGDIVQRVNELEVTTPENALEAYRVVRNAKELRIDMVRQGRPLRLVLEIVDPATN
jgi:general secretion pathway protein C